MTAWVLGGRDPTEVKLSVQRRLEVEEERLATLEESLKASKHLTSGMDSILASFESKLSKLEGTILPVYQETENLQRRQENIDMTLSALDHVIAFYKVADEVEKTVESGPTLGEAGSLEHYLHTMSRLKGALDYFERHNPQSIELENVKTRYEKGGEALSREFRDLVERHSKAIPPPQLLDAIVLEDDQSVDSNRDDFASLHPFPEDVQTNLIQIAEWLNLNDHDHFLHVYGVERGKVVMQSLDQLKHHRKSMSGGSVRQLKVSPSLPRKFSSPMVMESGSGTPTGKKVSRIQSSLNRKFSSLSHRMEAATGLTVGRRSLGGAIQEDAAGEWEVDTFCLCVTALQRLMKSEQVLMVGIIPPHFQKPVFERIVKESMASVITDGEAIIGRVKSAVSNNDFLAIMSLFYIIRNLMSLKPQMDRTLDGSDVGIRSKYNSLINQFFGTGSMALDGFVDGIRSDATTKEKMPRDGTVFQLTSNVILFLEQLLDYVETISAILTQDTSYNQTLLRCPRKISVNDRSHALVGIYIRKVLIQLNLTLVNKSETYPDAFLKAIFRLNNNEYILKSLQKCGLLDVVQLAEPECEENYNAMILEQKRLYSQSWGRVLNYIWSPDDIPTAILMAPGRLSDKYCRIIKEKFAGFNKEIEDIATTQRSYSVPDVELRESLKRDNKEYILPKYNSFYEKYVNVAFTKHPEKYVKYTPAQVSALIDCFFDAAA
ncbi:hypothetical protein TCAL_00431 [Tigriopus californicus]|uniref:Exocyst complex component 7 n=1 Tax=Tigriopus californicus TaxID=6832 RepID=A0A553NEF3_TIGCA|nr:exocyst complex component 7-like [Tigriopus californicus]TRY63811.1 hypothetical protein TCAL_00431 [Tigriopus californicus]|eukprot:TCALIF_00431-PA protein Name:"Similar to exo70 Exocyst complex component 7 (Drosophila melanogaster)" AED:0.11 eAED:0.11 QI:0/-1/0/1/-1/1/1/0/716